MAGGEGKPPRSRGNSGRDIAFEVEIGSRIRAARVAAGLTQRALGDAVGIAYQKLQKYELGQDRIAVSTLQRIARALGLHPGELFDDPMPRAIGAALDVMVARRSIELIQAVPCPYVAEQLLALVEELVDDNARRESRVPALSVVTPISKLVTKRARRSPPDPTQAVVAPLLEMLRQSGTGDAGALAQLLGQALAEAEKIVKRSAEPCPPPPTSPSSASWLPALTPAPPRSVRPAPWRPARFGRAS